MPSECASGFGGAGLWDSPSESGAAFLLVRVGVTTGACAVSYRCTCLCQGAGGGGGGQQRGAEDPGVIAFGGSGGGTAAVQGGGCCVGRAFCFSALVVGLWDSTWANGSSSRESSRARTP